MEATLEDAAIRDMPPVLYAPDVQMDKASKGRTKQNLKKNLADDPELRKIQSAFSFKIPRFLPRFEGFKSVPTPMSLSPRGKSRLWIHTTIVE